MTESKTLAQQAYYFGTKTKINEDALRRSEVIQFTNR